jgi:hypothetical protein
MTPRPKTTDITSQLAEDMTSILDYLSRLVGAADMGNSDYVHEKASQLARATRILCSRLSKRPLPADPAESIEVGDWHDPDKQFDPARLRALIARDARHYAAGRALYPVGGDAAAAAVRRALESAANAIRFDPATGFTPTQADVIAQWLLERAEQEVSD